MRQALMGLTLLCAPLACGASYLQATVDAVKSPAELLLSSEAGSRTVRLPAVTNPPSCSLGALTSQATSLLPKGTPVRVLESGSRARVYFELGGETVEWTQVVLGGGFAAFEGKDADLQDAQSTAKAARLGMWAGCSLDDVFSRVAQERAVARPLLYAVALTESGRGGKPWPWTLNVAGQSYYYDSREKAHEALVGFIKRGHGSIDVGYMQVNLAYNGKRFKDTWQALDPYQNVLAAAEILRENYAEVRDIRQAVGRYHSRTPWRSRDYYDRVARHYYASLSKETK